MKHFLKTYPVLITFLTLVFFTACQNTSQPVEREVTEEEVITEVVEETIPANAEELEVELTDAEDEDELETQAFTSYEYLDIPIPKSFLTTAVNAYLAGAKVNLDNWGSSFKDGNWYIENSYVREPNGQKNPINIPPSPTVSIGKRHYNAYINNLSTQSINVFLDGPKVGFEMMFEDKGDEIKVGCHRKGKPCKVHLIKHAGQINNAQVNVWLTPVFKNGEISFKDFKVEFDFDLQPNSWLLNKALIIMNWFTNTDNLIKKELTKEVNAWLKDNNTIAGLTKDLNEEIIERATDHLQGVLGNKASNFVKDNLVITNLKDSGIYYIITVRYPAPVTKSSVRIPFVGGFRVIDSSKTITCPKKVSFKGAIYIKYEGIRGTVRLISEDGTKTKKLKWKGNKNTLSKFIITRQWSKPNDGKEYKGWSYMVISYKDVFGIKHVKKSRVSHFSRTCEFGVTQ